MEHRLLIDPVQAARENLVETYVGLARAVPDALVCTRENFVFASGPPDLSFANFAAGFGPVADQTARIARIAEFAADKPGFWVFCMDGDQPEDIDQDFTAAGFALRHRLDQMVCEPSCTTTARLRPTELHDFDGRFKLAKFVTNLFFTRTAKGSQTRIAQATARSKHRLFGVTIENTVAAALMLCETPSSVGLYNLCVSLEHRREGIGTGLVRFAQNWAAERQKPLVLQCNDTLTAWYTTLGLEPVATVRAYTFGNNFRHDII